MALTQADIDSLFVEMGLNIEAFSGKENLHVYPNPATGILNIENLPREAVSIKIYTISGILVKSSLLQNSLELSSLAPGGYILKVIGKDEKEIGTAKFILK